MIRRKIHVHLLAAAALLTAAWMVPCLWAQAGGAEPPESASAAKQLPKSRLVLEKAAANNRVIRFPIHFTAAPGETVGAIRAEIQVPESSWKFQKVEPAARSNLKVSVRQPKRDGKAAGQGSPAILEVTFSGGSHVIRDGLIGTLQFLLPQPPPAPPDPPRAHILATLPPQAESSAGPAEAPFDLPPEPAANPSAGCFFFSH